MNLQTKQRSPIQGFWPNPITEAFRRPIRTQPENHLHNKKATDPYSVINVQKNGYQIYFIENSDDDDDDDDETSQESTEQECTQCICFNKIDLLNVVNNNDIKDDFEINDIDLCNKYMMNNNINDLNDVMNEDIRGQIPPKYNNSNNMIDNKFYNNNHYDMNEKMWSKNVPECTSLSYNSNKKYTYTGYLCSFIKPIINIGNI